jgi:hypothetical protein
MLAPTAGIIGLKQKPNAGAVAKDCHKERTEAVTQITKFCDDGLSMDFSTRPSRSLVLLNPPRLPSVFPKAEFSPC